MVDIFNCYNFVKKKLCKDLLGLVLKREAFTLTVSNSFLSKIVLRRVKIFILHNCKNSNTSLKMLNNFCHS